MKLYKFMKELKFNLINAEMHGVRALQKGAGYIPKLLL